MSTPLVIIPTYNERDNLSSLVFKIRAAVPRVVILIVDDNSPDGTGGLADSLAKANHNIHVLHRQQKAGLGKAYLAGFDWTRQTAHDPICTMDADLSHDPKKLPDLIRTIVEGADIAVGSRYVSGGRIRGWNWYRYLLSYGTNWFARLLLGLAPRDVTAGYKCYRRSFIDSLNLDKIVSPGYAFQVEMLTNAAERKLKIKEIPITFHDRTIGVSKVSRHELWSSAKSLLGLVWQRRGLNELSRFATVGLLNFMIDIGVTNLLVLGFKWNPAPAGYVGVTIALVNSFFLNRRYTFNHPEGRVINQFLRFGIVNGTGAIIHSLIYTLLLTRLHIWYNFAKILAVMISFGWNFLGSKHWAFKTKTSPLNSTAEAAESKGDMN